MSDTNENNTDNTNDHSRQEQNNYVIPKSTVRILITIGSICVGIVGWLTIQLYDLNKNISENNIKIESVKDNVEHLSSEIENIKIETFELDKGLAVIESRVSAIETELNRSPISASDNIVGYLDNASISYNNIPTSTSAIPSDICIGSDADGKEYFASDVINETVFLTYNEDDKEVYFLGQFDENYHWDGYCVTNTYNSDGTLSGICESNFDGGNRLDYISFYSDTETVNEWIYTNRECKEDGNYGESIRYSLLYNDIKNFTSTNVRVSDFIYIDDFISGQTHTVLTYYNGKTYDGKFNDDSNAAYYIKFDNEGYVNILYIGSFKDGDFDSDNGKEIVYDDTEGVNGYLYYEGAFKDGNRLQEITIENKIDQAQIDLIMGEINMDQKVKENLKWR